ncbi:hypothetical protein ACFSJU_01620 [Paradesertivirga mongoliensis]|uniref:Tetratricopeptide repeat protein n=1 Tax=Paradesertivirga mongoliensis TaxID=2100740 RepID=A0ABW4ZG99_9SPHI|nr:hypothetical protein [Pedobacter mongoliensis]
MLTARARFAVVALTVIFLAWTTYQQVHELSAILVFGILYLIYGYFKEGTVVLASKAYHNQDFIKVERLLKQVKYPDRLKRSRRGYFEFMSGNIELKKGNYPEAERHFQIASRFPLKNESEKGLVLSQLANLNLRKKEYDKARAYIEIAKELKISARVKSIIEKIELEIQKGRE